MCIFKINQFKFNTYRAGLTSASYSVVRWRLTYDLLGEMPSRLAKVSELKLGSSTSTAPCKPDSFNAIEYS